ncbi:MAG: hypothetical protein OHK93_005817 [Ramalina farinacea]|uniref:Uncharacterized protein n=1 Tax=Ramalina farinacea TaxID=258253 RepID=A0AA43TTW7_9LECA|nr:hypothetical protein [Ramalina farinacea]
MAEEHHIGNLDPSAFFQLHDYDSSGVWTVKDIRRTYGLDDESAREVSEQRKGEVTGPGHHGDDEYEYEIHHFEKFHDENTREEDLTHPEDIEHFRKHDEMDAAAERQEMLDRMQIVEQNIPQKFRRY